MCERDGDLACMIEIYLITAHENTTPRSAITRNIAC